MHSASSNSGGRLERCPIGVKPNYSSNNSTVTNSIGCERIRNCGGGPAMTPSLETLRIAGQKTHWTGRNFDPKRNCNFQTVHIYRYADIIYRTQKMPGHDRIFNSISRDQSVLVNTAGCFWFIAKSIGWALKIGRMLNENACCVYREVSIGIFRLKIKFWSYF